MLKHLVSGVGDILQGTGDSINCAAVVADSVMAMKNLEAMGIPIMMKIALDTLV